MNRKKHKHKFFLPQYHTSCPTSSRQIHRYADKYLCAHGPNFHQSPTGPTESMFGLIHFPSQIVVVAYVQDSIQFGRPFFGKACFDIANGKPCLSQPSLKVGNDILF